MMRLLNIFLIAALVLAAADVYKIKFESTRQAQRVAKLRIEIRRERDAIAARLVCGADGQEFVQLRVDLGILQMYLIGRPDGERCHGLPTAVDLIRHELRRSRQVAAESWHALERELQQFQYRRLALAALAEGALAANDAPAAVRLVSSHNGRSG